MRASDLPTPCLVVDGAALAANMATMGRAHPGPKLRPHVKAFKSTALARELAAAGHRTFCCATPAEMVGMARASLGDDLLLANEVVDPRRLAAMVEGAAGARLTVAVDSPETIAAAAGAGIREVLIDVEVGLPRCGCPPDDAGRLAEAARAAGMEVRGVMGYEGHLMMETDDLAAKVEASMAILLSAHDEVGGDVVSGGGTGTWDVNRWITELQAGSYTLMDGQYVSRGLPFRPALWVLSTVISANRAKGWAVADAGLKSLSTDHGDPTLDGTRVWFCSDEHTTFAAGDAPLPTVGDRVRLLPGHVDPTVNLHDRLHVLDGDGEVVDVWPVDLRGWDVPLP